MVTPPDDTTADLHAVIAALRAQLDAALAEKAELTKALAEGNDGERVGHQASIVGNETLKAENEELLAAQAAGLEVLQAMVASPGDSQPVFDLIAQQAAKLCEVPIAAVAVFDGTMVRLVSQSGFDAAYAEVFAKQFPRVPSPNFAMGRAILNGRVEQIEDTGADNRRGFTPPPGPGSALAVPLLRKGVPLGVIAVGRRVSGPYSKNQIAILQTFAEQAVIAIGSAETLRELRARTSALAQRNSEYGERIEHQSATIDVLKVMSASPGDTQPVFNLIVIRARELCNGEGAGLLEFDGELVHSRAWYGQNADDIRAYSSLFPMAPSRVSIACRAIVDGQVIHIRDAREEPELLPVVRDSDLRSLLALPLLRDGKAIGAIALNALEPGGFTDSQVALLRTFAEQAVIAISSAETYRALQGRTRDLQEALEQQTATAEVLNVISRSTFDLKSVLARVAEMAARLCVADQAAIVRHEGGALDLAANWGFPPEYEARMKEIGPIPVGADAQSVSHRAVLERRVIHIPDVAAVPRYPDAPIRLGRQRTSLGVPLLREGEPVGLILLARQRVEPFTDQQIDLVRTFADQAVIAIENTRLLTEQREALEQQTAAAEVLQVINSSPGNLSPVFEAILEKAHKLCDATKGAFILFDGSEFELVATRGISEAWAQVLRRTRGALPGPRQQLLSGATLVQIPDASASDNPMDRDAAALTGARTVLFVPLRRDGALLGYITAYRQEVRLFTDRQVALLENFAAQAVIAMENARLITETREALEQQTATAEVLGVINASPGDLAPVFEVMLEKAMRLSGAVHGTLTSYNGEHFRCVTSHNLPEALFELLREPRRAAPNSPQERLLNGENIVHIADMRAQAWEDNEVARAGAEIGFTRTALYVPLRKDNALLGYIGAQRREVRPFTDKQIALLQSFAEQAVIAMENARLLDELRQRTDALEEALEYQTATSDVLKVISRSTFDLQAVLDTLVATAARLCAATRGFIATRDEESFRPVATISPSQEEDAFLRGLSFKPGRGTVTGEALFERGAVHVADIAADPAYASAPAVASPFGEHPRSLLSVPLLREGELIGVITLARSRVAPFTDRQIELVRTFADQAVIAMENARLIEEQREALEQQTATAEVLEVINSSPGDLRPVFQALLQKAHTLCEASFGALMTYDGERFHAAAHHGIPAPFREFLGSGVLPGRGDPFRLIVDGAGFAHTHDLLEVVARYPSEPLPRAAADLGGIRTLLVVPLRKDSELLGVITAYRQEMRPFSDKQIALLQNFSAQAVIAMENARLITETREALEQQTATAEVLQVINASPGNLGPVFEAMLDKAVDLCGAAFGILHTYDGERFHHGAFRNIPAAYVEFMREHPPIYGPASAPGRLALGEHLVHILDISDTEAYRSGELNRRAIADLAGARTLVGVALRKDSALIGAIVVFRQEVRAFSDKQIALLENFAAQGVIAMENARLLTETREALEQQTATAEVLQVINSSPGDLKPVFDAILNKAHNLCGAEYGVLLTYDGEVFWPGAVHGDRLANSETFRRGLRPGFGFTKLIQGERLLHIHDMAKLAAATPDDPVPRALYEISGIRTQLAVPLRRDDELLGIITANRKDVRPFVQKEITLLESFAAQAVIAMENARLLTEQREALEQQTATAEVLTVINASPGNLAPVFDTMLEKAMRLCGAAYGVLRSFDGESAHLLASRGVPSEYAGFLARNAALGAPPAGTDFIRALQTGQPTQTMDARESVGYRSGAAGGRAIADLGGARTILHVPLVKDQVSVGLFTLYRQEVRRFSDKQIALLENFAAQAVIAMENARLLNEVRQRQEELRVTFENMGDGVAMFDGTQRLVAWNRNFQEILDLPDALLEQHRTYEEHLLFLAARGDFGTGVDTVEQINELVASTGHPYGYERTRPDGRVIEIRRNPVPDGGFVVIYSDITERKRSEEEIRAARDAAEAALRELKAAQASLIQAEKMASLGQLTAGIAHEIKNPLNFVNNFAELSGDLLDELHDAVANNQQGEIDDLTATLKGNLAKIAEHGRRADGIVRSMLEHSRGSSGERRSVDLNALVEEALNLAYHGARARDQSFNITLQRGLDEGIAPITLVPQDITRVLLNLFSNGFYAARRRQSMETTSGFEPTLSVTTRDLGDAVEIRVRDNGIGIPEEVKDKLFQPFFTTKPTGEGTGLGLSISYDIVTQQHGGSITVDSKVGEYSEFTIRLPRNFITRSIAQRAPAGARAAGSAPRW